MDFGGDAITLYITNKIVNATLGILTHKNENKIIKN